MIFPLDVNRVVVNSKKVAGDNRVQAIIAVCTLGSIFLFFILDYVLNTILGLGMKVTITVFVVIVVSILIVVFRFLIFDEDSKRRELEGASSDSFAKYMWLRAGTTTEVSVANEKATVFEYTNGSFMCMLELRFGSNDDAKARATRRMNEKMLEIACSFGLETRIIDVPEDFRSSTEFQEHISLINALKDKQSARNVMIINDAIMEASYEQCNVDVVYFMIKTAGNYQKADLETALVRIFQMMRQNVTAYRSVHFLTAQELMEFYRLFYKIAAIDLSMMRTIELSQLVSGEFQNVVTVLQLQSVSGKVYRSSDGCMNGGFNDKSDVGSWQ